MDCKNLKRRLNEGDKIDREMAEHINSCPSCARYAAPMKILDRAFLGVRDQESAPLPFDEIRKRVETKSAKISMMEKFMSAAKYIYRRRPRIVWGMGLAVAAFLFITLVPLSYTVTVGYNLTLEDVDSKSIDNDKVIAAFGSLGIANISISKTAGNSVRVEGFTSQVDARRAEAAFRLLTGYTGNAEIKPIREKVSGSLYAQVRDKLKIEIDTEGKTDAEIRAEIEQKLFEQGILNPEVMVKTGADGERHIEVFIPDTGNDSTINEQKIEMKMMGDGKFDFSPGGVEDAINIDTENMTPEEIKQAIFDEMKRRGHENVKVDVIVDENGKKDIRIWMEEEKKK